MASIGQVVVNIATGADGYFLESSELLAHYRPEFRVGPPPLHRLIVMAAPLGRLAGYRPRVSVRA